MTTEHKPNCLECIFFSADKGCSKGINIHKIRYENYEETCKEFVSVFQGLENFKFDELPKKDKTDDRK